MKKINLLVMSLVSAAALSFSSCSSDNDLGGGASGGNSQVDGFYMTLAIQTPTSNGTRTAENNPKAATAEESDVTSGTFYLVDANGKIAYTKPISEADWKAGKPSQGNNGTTQLNIEVENVVAGATYKVYFLANTDSPSLWKKGNTWSITPSLKAAEKFAKPFDVNNKFAMFNQNDGTVNGNGYTVTFKDDNKDMANAAKVLYNNTVSPIKIERITARIDEPVSNSTEIKALTDASATDAEKRASADAVKKVEKIELMRYAISNLANKSYIIQNWTNNNSVLNIPAVDVDFKYYQPTVDFGTITLYKDGGFIDKSVDHSKKDYVFENNASTANDATTMFFEYKVTLKADAGTENDFEDGTFYRYNNVIFTSFKDILKAYNDVNGLFNQSTPNADALKKELTDAKNDPTDPEAKIDEFRTKYKIEVFNEGKTYYKKTIQDQYLKVNEELVPNVIQRNSVYQLTVNNIFNVGAQVPNGTPDKNALFYLDVTVSVNPWVLNTQDVNLQ